MIKTRCLQFRLLAAFWWVSEKGFLALVCFFWFLCVSLVWFFFLGGDILGGVGGEFFGM